MPKDVTLHCLKIAKENNCFNYSKSSSSIRNYQKNFIVISIILHPNETEAEFYTGIKITNEKEAKQAAD